MHDHQGERKLFAEEPGPRIDFIEVELGEGVVDELESLEPCGLPPETDVLPERDLDVLLLARCRPVTGDLLGMRTGTLETNYGGK